MNAKEITTIVIIVIVAILLLIFIILLLQMLFSDKDTDKKELVRLEKEITIEEKTRIIGEVEKTYVQELQDDLRAKEFTDDEINRTLNKKIKDLLLIKSSKANFSNDFIINLITEKVSDGFVYELRKDVYGYNVVENKTIDHNAKQINSYLESLQGVETSSQIGKRLSTFKYNGKSFALVSQTENDYKITLKCGPQYAKKIMELYPGKVTKAQFPHGLIWFTITNEISLEFTKSLLEISYTIAKAGY